MKAYIDLILVLIVSLCIFFLYANSNLNLQQGSFSLEKIEALQWQAKAAVDSDEDFENQDFDIDFDKVARYDVAFDSVKVMTDTVEVVDLSILLSVKDSIVADSIKIDSIKTESLKTDSVEIVSSAKPEKKVPEKKTKEPKEKVPEVAVAEVAVAEDSTATESVTPGKKHRILLFGDSMVDGFGRRLSDYADKNGHTLTAIIRFSSTTIRWASVDKLKKYLKAKSPTFIIVCLGSNEMFVKNLKPASAAIDTLMSWFGSTPFVWVGPPNWAKDSGINNLIKSKVGADRFFDSRKLTFERTSDNIHPTYASSEKWVDKVAIWLQSSETRVPIRMEKPKLRGERKYKLLIWKQIIP